MKDIGYYFRRILFLGAFVLAGVALVQKILNFVGYTFLGSFYTPWRLLELSAICLLFVVVLQLKELNDSLSKKPTKDELK